jgi:membrane associated rhomboid family serine protease
MSQLKSYYIVIGIFLVVILFLLVNSFLSSKFAQPKIILTTPTVVIQNPVKLPSKTVIQYKTVRVHEPVHHGLVHKIKQLF